MNNIESYMFIFPNYWSIRSFIILTIHKQQLFSKVYKNLKNNGILFIMNLNKKSMKN